MDSVYSLEKTELCSITYASRADAITAAAAAHHVVGNAIRAQPPLPGSAACLFSYVGLGRPLWGRLVACFEAGKDELESPPVEYTVRVYLLPAPAGLQPYTLNITTHRAWQTELGFRMAVEEQLTVALVANDHGAVLKALEHSVLLTDESSVKTAQLRDALRVRMPTAVAWSSLFFSLAHDVPVLTIHYPTGVHHTKDDSTGAYWQPTNHLELVNLVRIHHQAWIAAGATHLTIRVRMRKTIRAGLLTLRKAEPPICLDIRPVPSRWFSWDDICEDIEEALFDEMYQDPDALRAVLADSDFLSYRPLTMTMRAFVANHFPRDQVIWQEEKKYIPVPYRDYEAGRSKKKKEEAKQQLTPVRQQQKEYQPATAVRKEAAREWFSLPSDPPEAWAVPPTPPSTPAAPSILNQFPEFDDADMMMQRAIAEQLGIGEDGTIPQARRLVNLWERDMGPIRVVRAQWDEACPNCMANYDDGAHEPYLSKQCECVTWCKTCIEIYRNPPEVKNEPQEKINEECARRLTWCPRCGKAPTTHEKMMSEAAPVPAAPPSPSPHLPLPEDDAMDLDGDADYSWAGDALEPWGQQAMGYFGAEDEEDERDSDEEEEEEKEKERG